MIRVLVVAGDAPRVGFIQRALSASAHSRFEYSLTSLSSLDDADRNRHDIASDVVLLFAPPVHGNVCELVRAAASLVHAPIVVIAADADSAGAASEGGAADVLLDEQLTGPLLERSIRAVVAEHRIKSALDGATDRVHAERALRASEARLSAVFSSSPLAINISDLNTGRIIDANLRFSELTGFTLDQLRGRSSNELRIWVEPELRDELVGRLRRGEPTVSGRTTFRQRNGDVRDVMVSFSQPPDDREHLLGVFTDLTDSRRLEDQLRQAQKMEAVGRLASGVAHDFNNLLTAIMGYAELATRQVLPNQVRRDLEELIKAAESGSALTRQLLAFSRRSVLELRLVDLNAVLHDMQSLIQRLIGEDISFRMELDPALKLVRADPTQIEQTIMNLALNARDAMPSGGKLLITTTHVDRIPAGPQADGSASVEHVAIAVSDTGIGMDAATKSRLFEPFFTTKELGRGTGLGLATVFGIVKQSGGAIEVETAPGAGSTFTVYLPVAGTHQVATGRSID